MFVTVCPVFPSFLYNKSVYLDSWFPQLLSGYPLMHGSQQNDRSLREGTPLTEDVYLCLVEEVFYWLTQPEVREDPVAWALASQSTSCAGCARESPAATGEANRAEDPVDRAHHRKVSRSAFIGDDVLVESCRGHYVG